MDLIKELRLIRNWLDKETICDMNFELAITDDQIALELNVRAGWETLIDDSKCWNACDWETNIRSAENYVRNFDYKKYQKISIADIGKE